MGYVYIVELEDEVFGHEGTFGPFSGGTTEENYQAALSFAKRKCAHESTLSYDIDELKKPE